MSSPADEARALAEQLAALGVAAEIERDGPLAILRPRLGESRDEPQWNATIRAAIVAAARRCGFTHVALELSAPGDHDSDDADVRRVEPRA